MSSEDGIEADLRKTRIFFEVMVGLCGHGLQRLGSRVRRSRALRWANTLPFFRIRPEASEAWIRFAVTFGEQLASCTIAPLPSCAKCARFGPH